MATQSIRNIMNNSIARIIPEIKKRVREEGQKKLEELSSSPDFKYRLDSFKDKLPQPFAVNKVSETMDWKIYHGQHWDNKSPYYRSSENVLDTIQYYLGENK